MELILSLKLSRFALRLQIFLGPGVLSVLESPYACRFLDTSVGRLTLADPGTEDPAQAEIVLYP